MLSQRGLQQSSGVSLPFVNGGMLRASLAPLAAPPSQAHPPCLPPGYGTLWSSGRGRLKRGASVPVRSLLAGVPARSLLATASPPLRLQMAWPIVPAPGLSRSVDKNPARMGHL